MINKDRREKQIAREPLDQRENSLVQENIF